jgi:tripartite-type tricarboxylate transporter receptor subunit TctC
MPRRTLIPSLLVCWLTAASAHGDAYPSKPIALIVPFPPGGTTDIIARGVADKLTEELGKPVVVENRAGAGGSTGALAIARAAPDGYTIGMSTVSTHAVNPACNPAVGYDPKKDFSPITSLAWTPNVLAVNPQFPAQNYKQFISVVRNHPDTFRYASSGNCGLAHMMGEQFKLATRAAIVHVPYRGIGPALNDVLAGQIEMIFDNVPSSLPSIKTGKLRPIAVAWHTRLESMPNVPTFAELGMKQVNAAAWYGLVAPAGTPDAIIRKINVAVRKVLAMPDLQERLRASGSAAAGNSPAEHAQEIHTEYEKMKYLVKAQNIRMGGM